MRSHAPSAQNIALGQAFPPAVPDMETLIMKNWHATTWMALAALVLIAGCGQKAQQSATTASDSLPSGWRYPRFCSLPVAAATTPTGALPNCNAVLAVPATRPRSDRAAGSFVIAGGGVAGDVSVSCGIGG